MWVSAQALHVRDLIVPWKQIPFTGTDWYTHPPLKETKLSAGFSNFPARCVSPQQRRRLLEIPPCFFLPSAFSVPTWNRRPKHCCSQSPPLSITFPVTRCLHPHGRVPVLSITQLQEYCNHTASFHSVTAVIYWENRLYNPYSMPLENWEFLFSAWLKVVWKWSKSPGRSHIQLIKKQSIITFSFKALHILEKIVWHVSGTPSQIQENVSCGPVFHNVLQILHCWFFFAAAVLIPDTLPVELCESRHVPHFSQNCLCCWTRPRDSFADSVGVHQCCTDPLTIPKTAAHWLRAPAGRTCCCTPLVLCTSPVCVGKTGSSGRSYQMCTGHAPHARG